MTHMDIRELQSLVIDVEEGDLPASTGSITC
ncbi:hypothetical protein Amir_4846 [Actinosynnema mirum DSM 43827]|uniref:Uncharacterized protein n=1 Tax=Actinosynnema mirum (strain ATCC 29888 / DSM 43827 / JCM 3225 / NBRC 14064 / NCIMB 13271 / NRRL B-12336 / IMRU 3971 / 101) TaxID=446462 RepID=C6WPH1_ACTMD|nr:hypothetical protein Amir_4846 [Actinosynnema mirum DSM 43827]